MAPTATDLRTETLHDAKAAIAGRETAEHKYVNDFLYFAVRREPAEGGRSLTVCSGINLDRFMPIVRLRCGLGSNPILSGLQLVNFDICSQAIAAGGTLNPGGRKGCGGIAPTKEAWYSQVLRIDNASRLSSEELVASAVGSLLRKIVASSGLDVKVPDSLPTPAELQTYLETLCRAMPKP